MRSTSSTGVAVAADDSARHVLNLASEKITCKTLAVKRYTDDFEMDVTEEGGTRCLTSLRSVTFRAACVVPTGASVATGTSFGLLAV